jgi:imidazolonepropionase-like amidohydrolase
MSAGDDPTHTQYSPAEIAVVVEEATARGTYVMAHAQGSVGIKNALRAGVRSIEHGVYLDDEAIDLFLAHDAVLVPTLVAPLAVIAEARRPGSGIPQTSIDKALRTVDVHRDSVAKAIAAGVTIAMGTDSGVGAHGRNLDELAQLAELGMGLEQALRSATSIAAGLIPDALVGRLADGYLADAVVVDGTLEHASDLGRISGAIRQVWQNGALVHGR